MSRKTVVFRSAGLVASAGLAATPLLMAGGSAFAATDCGTGTEVSAGLCEAAFTTAGDFTFTAPSGVSKVSAVVVGAGGGSNYNVDFAYGGGGGDVVFVESVDVSATVAFTVGAGGDALDGWTTPNDGGDSILGPTIAAGGDGASGNGGGNSGNGYLGVTTGGSSGTGAGGGASGDGVGCQGGAGLTASAAAAGSNLFPALLGEPEYGMGGDCYEVGGSSVGDYAAGHGGDATASDAGDDGNDGAVIFRWATLPDTGMSLQPWAIGAGVAAVAAGALFTSGLMRTRRKGRHSA